MKTELDMRYATKKEMAYIMRLKREVMFLRVLLVVGIVFVVFANWVLVTCYI